MHQLRHDMSSSTLWSSCIHRTRAAPSESGAHNLCAVDIASRGTMPEIGQTIDDATPLHFFAGTSCTDIFHRMIVCYIIACIPLSWTLVRHMCVSARGAVQRRVSYFHELPPIPPSSEQC